VNWQQHESGRAGWVIVGDLQTSHYAAHDYWSKVVRLIGMVEGRCIDYVDGTTAGVFSLGVLALPLDARAAAKPHEIGGAGALLAAIPPDVLRATLGAVCERHGVGFERAREAGGPAFTRGLRLIAGDEIADVMFGCSDGYAWTPDQMNVAREWALAFSETLRHPSARRAAFDASAMALRAYMGAALPMQAAGNDLPTKRASAVFLTFAVHAYEAARRLQAVAGWNAESMMDHASKIGAWPETFAARVPRLRAALTSEVW